MNSKIKFGILCGLLVMFSSCKRGKNQFSEEGMKPVSLQYAKSFELEKGNGYTLLKIHGKGHDRSDYQTFKLVPANMIDSPEPGVIPVPCKRIICLSSTQLTYFFALDSIGSIVGTNSSRHLFNKEMNQRIKMGIVKHVGKEGHFNAELIASLHPDVIFVSPFKTGGYDVLKSLGFNLVPMAAFQEESPLGRAEWVKMIAAFTGQEQQADTLFEGIAKRYQALKSLTAKAKNHPTIFSGKMKSGTWFVPGGDSFYAHLFKDAGAQYIFKDNKRTDHPLDFETVYAAASKCDFWRIASSDPKGYNKQAMMTEDPRYGDFKAFKENHIMYCNIREKPYYEQDAMKPDVILADYIHFLHPELLPNHNPTFYDLLK